jgi:hypothetical protein
MNTQHSPLTRFAPALFLLCALLLFSFPREASAFGCGPASASLDSSTYSANVGSTFSVILTFAPVCAGAIQDNTSGSFATVPNTDTDLDCNAASCTGFNTSPKTATLKCEAAGTYTIRGANLHAITGSDVFSSNATVTCKAKPKSIIGLPGNYLTLSSGLVGYWPFDGKTTNWATGKTNDLSGYGNTGQLINMSTSTSPTPGKIGQALKFNGSTNYVSESTSISNIQSVAFWAKATTGVSQGLINLTGSSVYISTNASSVISGTGFTSPTYYVDGFASTTPGLYDANWHRIVVTGTAAITGSQIEVGRANGVYFNGSIDDVRIYKRALSASEVQELYNIGAANVAHSNTTALSSGLVGYWNFDGGTTHWNTGKVDDVSGNGNTGQLINMSTSTSPVAGKIGQALKFDGTSSYVNIPASASLTSTNTMTVSAWVKTASSSPYILAMDPGCAKSTTHCGPYSLSTINGGRFTINNFTGVVIDSSVSIADGKWHHVVGTYDKVNAKIFVDGVQTGSTAYSNSISGTSLPIRIGGDDRTPVGNFFPGTIDDVRIYNRALSASEVQALYRMGRVRL